ncbi:hypothetical protein AAG570_005382 [Ranatra chinensis]|uniref:Dynein heavy chain tail domain-containing protein n=1 Tax=Ranatra chinensis TaxID=642074 RepID=A0ABD0YCY8_9HEMI
MTPEFDESSAGGEETTSAQQLLSRSRSQSEDMGEEEELLGEEEELLQLEEEMLEIAEEEEEKVVEEILGKDDDEEEEGSISPLVPVDFRRSTVASSGSKRSGTGSLRERSSKGSVTWKVYDDAGDEEGEADGEEMAYFSRQSIGRKATRRSRTSKDGLTSPPTVVETLSEEAMEGRVPSQPQFVPIKKIVEKTVLRPHLHIKFGVLNDQKVEEKTRYVYFIRRSIIPIPWMDYMAEAEAEMPHYIMVGCWNSDAITCFTRTLKLMVPYLCRALHEPPPLMGSVLKGLPGLRQDYDAEADKRQPTEAAFFVHSATIRRRALTLKRFIEREDGPMDKPTECSAENEPLKVTLEDVLYGKLGKKPSKRKEAFLKIRSSSYVDECIDAGKREDPGPEPMKEKYKNLIIFIGKKLVWYDRWANNRQWSKEMFDVPSIPQFNFHRPNLKKFVGDAEFVSRIEELARYWSSHIKEMLAKYKATKAIGESPFAELEYWHERTTELSPLVRQCGHRTVKIVSRFLRLTDSAAGRDLKDSLNEIKNYYEIARDNVTFLKNCRKEFKHRVHYPDLDVDKRTAWNPRTRLNELVGPNRFRLNAVFSCTDSVHMMCSALPDLVRNLRIMWVLSNHYGNEDTMLELVDRIVSTMVAKVTSTLELGKLFKRPIEEIIQLCDDARTLMAVWKSSYLEERHDIESTICQPRWEFDKGRLFRITDYIGKVASDLHYVSSVMKEFYDVFCEDYETAVVEGTSINAMSLRIRDLSRTIVAADFDVFNPDNLENWQAVMEWFDEEVLVVEDEALHLINNTFENLRCIYGGLSSLTRVTNRFRLIAVLGGAVWILSSVKALKLLLKFKYVETKPRIYNRLMTKFEAVMRHFIKEVCEIEEIFIRERLNPPLLRSHPPTAGRVFWCRLLFESIKLPLMYLKTIPEVQQTQTKTEAFRQYMELGLMMCQYEKGLVESWMAKEVPTISKVLHMPIIRLVQVRTREYSHFRSGLWLSGCGVSMNLACAFLVEQGEAEAPQTKRTRKKTKGAGLSAVICRGKRGRKKKENVFWAEEEDSGEGEGEVGERKKPKKMMELEAGDHQAYHAVEYSGAFDLKSEKDEYEEYDTEAGTGPLMPCPHGNQDYKAFLQRKREIKEVEDNCPEYRDENFDIRRQLKRKAEEMKDISDRSVQLKKEAVEEYEYFCQIDHAAGGNPSAEMIVIDAIETHDDYEKVFAEGDVKTWRPQRRRSQGATFVQADPGEETPVLSWFNRGYNRYIRGQDVWSTGMDIRLLIRRRTVEFLFAGEKGKVLTPNDLREDITWFEFIGKDMMAEHGLSFVVNTPTQLFDIIYEAELLDYLGFRLPKEVLEVGVLKTRLVPTVAHVQNMADYYTDLTMHMSKAEVTTLSYSS